MHGKLINSKINKSTILLRKTLFKLFQKGVVNQIKDVKMYTREKILFQVRHLRRLFGSQQF